MCVEHLRNRPDRMRLPHVVCRDLQRIGKRSGDRRQLQHLPAGSALSVKTELRVVWRPVPLLLLILALGLGIGCGSTLAPGGGSGGKGGSGTGGIVGQGGGGGQTGGGAGGSCAACQSGAATACPAGVSAGALCSGTLQTCCAGDVEFQCGCNTMNCAWSPICPGGTGGTGTGGGGGAGAGGIGSGWRRRKIGWCQRLLQLGQRLHLPDHWLLSGELHGQHRTCADRNSRLQHPLSRADGDVVRMREQSVHRPSWNRRSGKCRQRCGGQ